MNLRDAPHKTRAHRCCTVFVSCVNVVAFDEALCSAHEVHDRDPLLEQKHGEEEEREPRCNTCTVVSARAEYVNYKRRGLWKCK